MTVSYSKDIATSSFGSFVGLLLRWRGSIYKFIWKDFAIFAFLYFSISLTYQFILNEQGKRWFDHLAEYCQEYNNLIPVAFILGFYVSIVVSRFWGQLNALPWPHRTAFFVAAMIHGNDEYGRILRRTIMRYLTIAYILTMRSICPPVRRRFPSLQHIRDKGLINNEEQKVLTEISRINRTDRIGSDKYKETPLETLTKLKKNDQQDPLHEEVCPNAYYVPLLWAVDLVNKAKQKCRITDHSTQRILIEEINNYRGQCGTLFNFDWITVPLVYTQVVTIAVYTFFLSCLLGRQTLDHHEGDLYFPVFTFLQFTFYMGWLEVAHCLLNPFGGDDDDFEINPLIEDNLQIAFTMVDELCDFSPKLEKDTFFDKVDVDITYNMGSVEYRGRRYQASAESKERKRKGKEWDCCGLWKQEEDNVEFSKRGKKTPKSGNDASVDPPRSGVSKSVTQTTSFSETRPLLSGDEDQGVTQHQQPAVGKQEEQGGDGTQTGRTGGGFRQAFIDEIHQSLHELRLGTRASIASNRNQFFNPAS